MIDIAEILESYGYSADFNGRSLCISHDGIKYYLIVSERSTRSTSIIDPRSGEYYSFCYRSSSNRETDRDRFANFDFLRLVDTCIPELGIYGDWLQPLFEFMKAFSEYASKFESLIIRIGEDNTIAVRSEVSTTNIVLDPVPNKELFFVRMGHNTSESEDVEQLMSRDTKKIFDRITETNPWMASTLDVPEPRQFAADLPCHTRKANGIWWHSWFVGVKVDGMVKIEGNKTIDLGPEPTTEVGYFRLICFGYGGEAVCRIITNGDVWYQVRLVTCCSVILLWI